MKAPINSKRISLFTSKRIFLFAAGIVAFLGEGNPKLEPNSIVSRSLYYFVSNKLGITLFSFKNDLRSCYFHNSAFESFPTSRSLIQTLLTVI